MSAMDRGLGRRPNLIVIRDGSPPAGSEPTSGPGQQPAPAAHSKLSVIRGLQSSGRQPGGDSGEGPHFPSWDSLSTKAQAFTWLASGGTALTLALYTYKNWIDVAGSTPALVGSTLALCASAALFCPFRLRGMMFPLPKALSSFIHEIVDQGIYRKIADTLRAPYAMNESTRHEQRTDKLFYRTGIAVGVTSTLAALVPALSASNIPTGVAIVSAGAIGALAHSALNFRFSPLAASFHEKCNKFIQWRDS